MLTSVGISARIDLVLKVVARFCGQAISLAMAMAMEYPDSDSNDRRIQFQAWKHRFANKSMSMEIRKDTRVTGLSVQRLKRSPICSVQTHKGGMEDGGSFLPGRCLLEQDFRG